MYAKRWADVTLLGLCMRSLRGRQHRAAIELALPGIREQGGPGLQGQAHCMRCLRGSRWDDWGLVVADSLSLVLRQGNSVTIAEEARDTGRSGTEAASAAARGEAAYRCAAAARVKINARRPPRYTTPATARAPAAPAAATVAVAAVGNPSAQKAASAASTASV